MTEKTEKEQALELLENQLPAIEAFERLNTNADFGIFRKFLAAQIDGYRSKLEDGDDPLARGGIRALRETLGFFDATVARKSKVLEQIAELKK